MIKKKFILVLVVGIFIGIGILICRYVSGDKLSSKSREDNTLSLWVTYWDDGEFFKELREREEHVNNVSFFAAYFDSDNKVFIPEVTSKLNDDIGDIYSDREWNHYLTIVNDKIKEDGSSSLKDTDLLRTLFESEESMDKHIDEIITLTLEGNYDGIEIDYEAIRKDMGLWEKFIVFSEKVYQRTTQNELGLRILLEPGAPMDSVKFPVGPEYAIMCYTLHGYGTNPGPKANPEFLEEMVDRSSSLPGDVEFILSTGGFSWAKLGKVKPVSTEESRQIVMDYKPEIQRDEESQYLYYYYLDEMGEKHTIWCTDDETITYLINVLKDLGVNKCGIW